MSAVLDYATPREAWLWARGVLRAHRGQAVATATCFLTAAGAGLIGPQLLGALVDEVAGGGRSTTRIDWLAVAFLASLLVTAVLRRSARWRAGVLGEELLAANRTQLVDRALALPLATVESVGTGALLSRATTDLDRVDSALRQGVPEVLTAVVTLVLTVIAMIVTSPLLALALLVAVPTVVFPTRRLWRFLPAAMARMLDAWAGLTSRVHESTAGARTLDALGLVERRVAGDDAALVEGVDRERDLRALHVRWTPWLELSHVLPVAATLVLGAWAYGAGMVSLGEVTTMVVYVQALATPLDTALWWVEDLMIAVVALRRVLGVRVPERRLSAATDARPGERGLHLEAVRFAYREDRPVLRGIDLDVTPGERLALVGGSGAGKSTLARLIAGISAPTSGAVRLDGYDVSTLDDDTLRGEVLLLTQEHHVFTGSVRDNLALPAGEFADDDLRAALELVGLAGLVRDAARRARDRGRVRGDDRPGAGRPAARARAGGPRRPWHRRARRSHLAAGHRVRASGRGRPRPGARRAHGHRDRASAAHRGRRGPGRGDGGRRDRRARAARGPAGRGRAVRTLVAAAA